MKATSIGVLLLSQMIVLPLNNVFGCEPENLVVIRSQGTHGWLGVSVQDMTPRLARSMGVETKEGALVNEVVDGSPASKGGIANEDIIIGFNRQTIVDAEDLVEQIRKVEPGAGIDIELVRGKEKKNLRIEVGEREDMPSLHSLAPMPPMDAHMWSFSSHQSMGMEFQELGGQLREYFGAPKNEGVLVAEVKDESQAAKAGFMAGDVILRAGNQTIREIDDIWDEVEEYEKGDKVTFEVLRQKSRKTLTMEMDRSGRAEWFGPPHGSFNFRFDPECEDWGHEGKRLERELQWELHRSKPDLETLRMKLKDLRNEIREWGREIKRKIEEELRSVMS